MDWENILTPIASARKFVAVGRIESVRGTTVVARGPKAPVGELCWIDQGAEQIACEVVGFEGEGRVLLTPYQELMGIQSGQLVRSSGFPLEIVAGRAVLGRVIDGMGNALDGKPKPQGQKQPIASKPIAPLWRHPITAPLWTGIRVIDALLTLGVGQRVGIFAGAGLGKTTLLRQLLSGVGADVAVVALVGERGREVAEFYQSLPPHALARTAIVAATSDMPAIMRLRAVHSANFIAESFRAQGANVVLVVDSLTRVAMAQREVGLEAGEIPSVRGYTPSVFHLLPKLLERAGRVGTGSITGIYTVLLDGDDPTDPIGDAVRGILDGNLYLSRSLAEQHHFPAVDILKSLSRVMPMVVNETRRLVAAKTRQALSRLERSRDMVDVGMYQAGSDPALDELLALEPHLLEWMRQGEEEWVDPKDAFIALSQLMSMDGGESSDAS